MMTNAAKHYAAINANQDRYGRDASFIANVLLNCTKPTTRLRNLLHHLQAGRQFTCLSFRMPYEGFFVDGRATRPEFLLAGKNADPNDYRLTS